MKIAGCQPDSGNPTVRDERGACGNVNYGGTRNPLHIPKGCMSETLCLRLRAPNFYPTLPVRETFPEIMAVDNRRNERCRL